MKYLFKVFFFLLAITIFIGCGKSSNSSETADSDLVEVGDYDRSVQSYIPDPQKALLSPSSLTLDDMKTSSRLLLTPGGVLKGLETSYGYQKVISYSCSSIGSGWFFVKCKYKDGSTIYDWECYTKEKI